MQGFDVAMNYSIVESHKVIAETVRKHPFNKHPIKQLNKHLAFPAIELQNRKQGQPCFYTKLNEVTANLNQ